MSRISDTIESYRDQVIDEIDDAKVFVQAVTTNSVYISLPDGYKLRISDHQGKEKYGYRWNIDVGMHEDLEGWRVERRQGAVYHRYFAATANNFIKTYVLAAAGAYSFLDGKRFK